MLGTKLIGRVCESLTEQGVSINNVFQLCNLESKVNSSPRKLNSHKVSHLSLDCFRWKNAAASLSLVLFLPFSSISGFNEYYILFLHTHTHTLCINTCNPQIWIFNLKLFLWVRLYLLHILWQIWHYHFIYSSDWMQIN